MTFSLFVPEEVTFSLTSLLAESAPEAAAVGPRGDQAVVDGDGIALNPLCPVGFDFNLSVTSDEFFKPPLRLASAVEPLVFRLQIGLRRSCSISPTAMEHVKNALQNITTEWTPNSVL